MSVDSGADHLNDELQVVEPSVAMTQWIYLHHLIVRCGGFVEYIDSDPDLPDMVFTANAGIVHNGRAVVSNFKHHERKGEERYFQSYFSSRGLDVLYPKHHFEGQGDSFILHDTLFLGCGKPNQFYYRSSRDCASSIAEFLGVRDIFFCHISHSFFYHLDTCFFPLKSLTDDVIHILYAQDAFDADTKERFSAMPPEKFRFHPVIREEASDFVCNSIQLGNHVIMPKSLGGNTMRLVLSLGEYKVHEVQMSEFLKAGGAARCLSLNIG